MATEALIQFPPPPTEGVWDLGQGRLVPWQDGGRGRPVQTGHAAASTICLEEQPSVKLDQIRLVPWGGESPIRPPPSCSTQNKQVHEKYPWLPSPQRTDPDPCHSGRKEGGRQQQGYATSNKCLFQRSVCPHPPSYVSLCRPQ